LKLAGNWQSSAPQLACVSERIDAGLEHVHIFLFCLSLVREILKQLKTKLEAFCGSDANIMGAGHELFYPKAGATTNRETNFRPKKRERTGGPL
jgi:hypothetical protein